MKKFSMTFLTLCLVAGVASAQTLQEGVNDWYAQRYKSAKTTFEKLLASNPNNIEATYWLGQTYIESADTAGAKGVYDKALLASANAPLVIVGRGQIDLMENKVSEARQRFEAAITMTKGKKGDDPDILNAVGRAIVDVYNDKTKIGDINYAVQKLEAAKARDAKSADILVNLGNAYRKAKPGEAGGVTFQTYNEAIGLNANFAPAYHRLAKLFESQRNWELYLKYLNDATTKDPKYAPAYYDLYYYYLQRLKLDSAQLYADKYAGASDPDQTIEYMKAATTWTKKDYPGAITAANAIVSKYGAQTQPKVYKLLADATISSGDTIGAKPFIDQYFAKAIPEETVAPDYFMKALVYNKIPGAQDTVMSAYKQALAIDTVPAHKEKLLKDAAKQYKDAGNREMEGDMLNLLVQMKPKPSINELFDVSRAYYFGGAYAKSYEAAKALKTNYPDSIYGYEWKFNNARIIDSTKRDSISIQDADSLLTASSKDSVRFKKQAITSAGYLVEYYANIAKDGPKAIEYAKRLVAVDPANPAFKNILDQLQQSQNRPPARTGTPTKKTTTPAKKTTGSSGKTPAGTKKPSGS